MRPLFHTMQPSIWVFRSWIMRSKIERGAGHGIEVVLYHANIGPNNERQERSSQEFLRSRSSGKRVRKRSRF